MSPRLPLLLLLGLALGAAEEVDRARSERTAERERAQTAFEGALAKADEKAVKALETAATAAQKRGDLAGAVKGWKEVLRFDPAHAQATQFFTATGNLESVLAEVAQRRPIPLPGSAPIVMPRTAMVQTVEPVMRGTELGKHKAGTIVMVQYVDGSWTVPRVSPTEANPDAETCPQELRLALVDLSTNTPVLLATVPAGTAGKPFGFTLPRDISTLAVAPAIGARPFRYQGSSGRVRYKVALIKP